MDAARWERVDALFAAALERPPDGRRAFLDRECEGDASLRADVVALLDGDRDDAFLELPASDEAVRAVAAGLPTRAGTRLGRFEIVGRLGAGGMGEVYQALDPKLERQVALKLIPGPLAADPDRARRFRREALAVSALNHPNILTVYEIDQVDGQDLLVSELVDGVTLRERMRQGPVPLATVVDVVTQAARGLAAAHALGIVHRDVKPENVMVRRDGLVKVLDFGVAKSTRTPFEAGERETATAPGEILGTLAYMSPEQARGVPVDARSDVWSLGVVLYELLTGASPFPGDTPSDRLAAILEREPDLPSERRGELPVALDRLVARMLAKDPRRRHADGAELLAELEALGVDADLGGAGAAASRLVRRARRGLRSPAGLAIAALVVAFLAAAIVLRARHGAAPPAIDSLAVLPFANPGKDPELEYLADGIADNVLRDLQRTPGLRVISHFSSWPHKGEAVARVGKQLGVSGIVTGSVRRQGDRLAVSVELVDPRDGSQRWGERYERPMAALPDLYRDVVRELLPSVGIHPSRTEQLAAAKRHTPPAEAYELYLKGRYYWNQQDSPDWAKCRDFFQRAVEVDPDYALAWAGLAHYYGFGAASGTLRPDDVWPRAEDTARRAYALDPKDPDSINSYLGPILYWHRDWKRGEALFVAALAERPSVELLNHYARYLEVTGRFDEAIQQRMRLLAIEPLSTRGNLHLTEILYHARRYEEALQQGRKALALDPKNAGAFQVVGSVLAHLGREGEAIGAFRQARIAMGDPELGDLLQRTYAASGFAAARAALSRRRLETLEAAVTAGDYVPPSYFAYHHLFAGDREAALAWSTRAFAEHNRLALDMTVDPDFDSLRSDPRFQAGVESLGLPRPPAAAATR